MTHVITFQQRNSSSSQLYFCGRVACILSFQHRHLIWILKSVFSISAALEALPLVSLSGERFSTQASLRTANLRGKHVRKACRQLTRGLVCGRVKGMLGEIATFFFFN